MNGVMTNNLTFRWAMPQTMLSNPAAANFDAFPLLAGTNPNPQASTTVCRFFTGGASLSPWKATMTTAGTGPYVAF